MASVILILILSSTVLSGTQSAYATATPPRSNIAMAKQTDNILTALSVGRDGALRVSWVERYWQVEWTGTYKPT